MAIILVRKDTDGELKTLKCKYQLYSSSTAAFSEVFGEGYERSWLHVMEISFDFRPTAEFGGCNFVLIFRLRRIVSARTDVAFDTVCITWHVCSLEFAIACLSIKDFLVSNGGAKGEWRSGTDWKYQTHVMDDCRERWRWQEEREFSTGCILVQSKKAKRFKNFSAFRGWSPTSYHNLPLQLNNGRK